MLVVDASALAMALIDDAAGGDRARIRLRGQHLTAPDLIDLEVTSVLRGRLLGGHLDPRRADSAFADLLALPLDRVPAARLLPRCWELRNKLTAYDAAYVALAETLAVPLLTADARLASAPGLRCPVDVLV